MTDRVGIAGRMALIVRQWFGPLRERRSWAAVVYLLIGMFSAVAWFVVLNAVGWTVLGLSAAGVGLLLVRPFFELVDALCRAECAMAAWVDVTIARRPLAPMRRLGLRAAVDPARWRQVGFLALNIVLGTALGAAGLAAFAVALLVTAAIAYADAGAIQSGVRLAVALALAGSAPRLAVLVGRLKAKATAWFLGVDRLAEAQQRAAALASQRQEILDAVAAERRRIERNLHDGVQQQLIAIGLDLAMAEQHLRTDPERASGLLVSAREKVQGSIGELRQLGRGLHPAILADQGIDAALSAVVAHSPIPVAVHIDPDLALCTDVAESVYFVASEALTNVLKHADASVASLHVAKVAANVRITVHDDGRGGADASRGTGIAGMRARVTAVDGIFSLSSPPGGPTTLVVEIPRQRPGQAAEP